MRLLLKNIDLSNFHRTVARNFVVDVTLTNVAILHY